MGNHLSREQKKAAKAFVQHVRDLETGSGLTRREFCRLIALPEPTYRTWFNSKTLPSEETRAKIRDAAVDQHGRLSTVVTELFGFMAVTAEPCGEATLA